MSLPHWHNPRESNDTGAFISGVRLRNSLTRKNELFVTSDGSRVIKWYVCGPTVYASSHMGHARNYMAADILRRVMQNYFGYEIQLVMNITDIDDKIILRARQNYLFEQYTSKHTVLDKVVLQDVAEAWSRHVTSFEAKSADAKARGDNPLARMFDDKHKEAIKRQESLLRAHKAGAPASALLDASRDAMMALLDSRHGKDPSIPIQKLYREHGRVFEKEYWEDMQLLGILPVDVITRVSEFVPEVIAYVKRIIDNGYAYESNGSVYFDTIAYNSDSSHTYGKLRPEQVGDLRLLAEGEGALIGGDRKKASNDFALWKASKPGEPSWLSPWGKGRPGWHIECSAMASAVLGDKLDIHSGGVDLQFPHHENEIAQAEAHYNCNQWTNFWLHSGHLDIDGLKMAKSLKNFITIRQALDMCTARQMRIMFLLRAWDGNMSYDDDLVDNAKGREKSFIEFFVLVRNVLRVQKDTAYVDQGWSGAHQAFSDVILKAQRDVDEALRNNVDTSTAMQAILALVSATNVYVSKEADRRAMLVRKAAVFVTCILRVFGVVHDNDGFGLDEPNAGNSGEAVAGNDREDVLAPVLDALAEFRSAVRSVVKEKKDVSEVKALAERLRESGLKPLGIELDDGGEKYTLSGEAKSNEAMLAPVLKIVCEFRRSIVAAVDSEHAQRELMALSDRVRDEAFPPLGVWLEDASTFPWKMRDPSELMAEIDARQKGQDEAVLKKLRGRLGPKKGELERMEKASLPTKKLFRSDEKYSEWSDAGVPTKLANGDEVTKKAQAKLQKQMNAHEKNHQKYLALVQKNGDDALQKLRDEIADMEAQVEELSKKLE